MERFLEFDDPILLAMGCIVQCHPFVLIEFGLLSLFGFMLSLSWIDDFLVEYIRDG